MSHYEHLMREEAAGVDEAVRRGSQEQVILGGLLTSTFLNLVVVPVLFRRWGADRDEATIKT